MEVAVVSSKIEEREMKIASDTFKANKRRQFFSPFMIKLRNSFPWGIVVCMGSASDQTN